MKTWLSLVIFFFMNVPLNGQDSRRWATFGGGCFWCTEAVYKEVKGVISVVSGYSGGVKRNPTYKEVNTGSTGHAEVIRIMYDSNLITYEELLEIFWATHNPTTLNRQENDIGPQYRSVIFYHTKEQQKLARSYKKELDASGAFDAPIVTEIRKARAFYKAEDFLQDYYNRNPEVPYCVNVIVPKLEKFRMVFKTKLKEEK